MLSFLPLSVKTLIFNEITKIKLNIISAQRNEKRVKALIIKFLANFT